MYKNLLSRVYYLFVALFFFSIACSEGEVDSSSGQVEHPIEENLPYYGEDSITVTGEGKVNADLPVELNRLRSYFNDKEKYTETKLSILVGEVTQTDIEGIDEENIVIFDSFTNRLITYNLSANTSNIAAPKGNGPGDINYGMEMSKTGNSVLISMESTKVSEFHCIQSDCKPEFDC